MLSAKRREPFSPFPVQRPIDVPPDELTGADMIPVFNQYVGFGDMVAANEVSQMLALRSRTVRLMLASSIPFADLKQSQAYLIGSVSNHWTMELGQIWRYLFGWTAEQQPEFYDSLPGTEARMDHPLTGRWVDAGRLQHDLPHSQFADRDASDRFPPVLSSLARKLPDGSSPTPWRLALF